MQHNQALFESKKALVKSRADNRNDGTGKEIAPFVFSVDVGTVLQQVLHHGHAVVSSCEVQRCGLTSLCVPAVHVL